jgi:hypothetical protein
MVGPHVPGHARWIYASLYLRGLGRFAESSRRDGRAAEQDPLNPTWHAIWAAGLRSEAVAAFERAHALAPWFALATGWLAAAHRIPRSKLHLVGSLGHWQRVAGG